MASFAEAAEKKRALSGQISSIVRTLALGVLAVTWLFLSGGKDAPAMVSLVPKAVMLIIAALCVFSLALDLLQYMAAYSQLTADCDAAKKSKAEKVTYHQDDVRLLAYKWKTRLAIVASLSLVCVLFWAAFNAPLTQECARVRTSADGNQPGLSGLQH